MGTVVAVDLGDETETAGEVVGVGAGTIGIGALTVEMEESSRGAVHVSQGLHRDAGMIQETGRQFDERLIHTSLVGGVIQDETEGDDRLQPSQLNDLLSLDPPRVRVRVRLRDAAVQFQDLRLLPLAGVIPRLGRQRGAAAIRVEEGRVVGLVDDPPVSPSHRARGRHHPSADVHRLTPEALLLLQEDPAKTVPSLSASPQHLKDLVAILLRDQGLPRSLAHDLQAVLGLAK